MYVVVFIHKLILSYSHITKTFVNPTQYIPSYIAGYVKCKGDISLI